MGEKPCNLLLFYRLLFYSQPPFPGVCRLLPVGNYSGTFPAIFGVVGGWGKGLAAYRTAFQGIILENLRFEGLSFLILQQHMTEHLTTDGIGNTLRAGNFLAPAKIEAVAVIVIAAQLADELYSLPLLPRCHPGQRPIRPPFNGRQCFDNVDCLSLFSCHINRLWDKCTPFLTPVPYIRKVGNMIEKRKFPRFRKSML